MTALTQVQPNRINERNGDFSITTGNPGRRLAIISVLHGNTLEPRSEVLVCWRHWVSLLWFVAGRQSKCQSKHTLTDLNPQDNRDTSHSIERHTFSETKL